MSDNDTIDSTEEIDAEEQAELSLLTENPDEWVKKQLDKAELVTMTPAEREMANLLIDRAARYAQETGSNFGYALSAAFDLFVTVAYYETVANTSWVYCPKGPPLLIHNFGVNACSRCLLLGEFHYYKAFKPQSGSIGNASTGFNPV